MAIPDFQTIMLPLLQFAGDGKDHSFHEALEHLIRYFKLTDDDIKELLPSKTQGRMQNRVYWSRFYLKQAGLVESPTRGLFHVTDDGKKVLATKPRDINVKFLMQFERFAEFKRRSGRNHGTETAQPEAEGQKTPKEVLEESVQRLRNELAVELLDTVRGCSDKFFEHLVVDLLVKMGYGGSLKDAARVTGGSGDQGIDGVIDQDRLGLDQVYVQAKRWKDTVNDKEIRNFVGSLAGRKANRGVFITTSDFTQKAKDYVGSIQQKVILIDGDRLAQLMIEHGVGVSVVAAYEVKRVDADYFAEE